MHRHCLVSMTFCLCESIREFIKQITAMFVKMTNMLVTGVDTLLQTSTELLQVTLCFFTFIKANLCAELSFLLQFLLW